jgi:hypothetical protein
MPPAAPRNSLRELSRSGTNHSLLRKDTGGRLEVTGPLHRHGCSTRYDVAGGWAPACAFWETHLPNAFFLFLLLP